ncbi:MAG: SUMF1/EgtB/PvdO family nonheme iron enzyme [Chloroflexota bacterium]|nr:SUMF1/EgtB/PvdO family nonheme iron enzyme [Chloroflexota bacterium]
MSQPKSEPNEAARQAQLNLLRRLYEQGALSEENYRAQLDDLGVDPATVFDLRDQRFEQQVIVAGDYVDQRPVTPQPNASPPVLDGEAALDHYLRHVVEANRRLRLQGIRSAGRLVSIGLEEVYVTLTATERRTVAAEEAWIEEMAHMAPGEAQRLARLGVGRPRETVAQVKVKVQEALAAHPCLVVLGNPGCGKTTLLRYLALTYARDLRGEKGLVALRLQIDELRLPIMLPLRDFACYLEAHHPDPSTDGPKLLLNYLRTYFANQDISLPERFFADRLQRGKCAMLLDGVDEVADFATRRRVARIIERFTIAYPHNRYVVTSRIVGYTGSARMGEGYVVTRVRNFTQADIERFVTHWNRAVEVALAGGETVSALGQAQRQSKALLEAIQNNERVRELAVNPLLLTVIALVQRYRAQLPERRTELYEEAIEVLLGKWDEAKGLETRAVMAGRELDAGDRRGLLEPVALWMMEQHAREIEAGELRRQLGQRFHGMCGDWRQAGKAVDEFLRLINERSGLLAERGQGVYGFSHLTFQEHLAARAVADRPDYIPYTLARLDDSWWREVVLLEAGYLSTQGKRRVTMLIQAIIDHKDEPEPYHNLVLAAEALRDVGPARVEGDLWGEVQHRLRREFERPLRQSAIVKRVWRVLGRKPVQSDAIRRRAVAAEALARIESGGPGTQPAFWRLPHGEPVWVEVPAGEFWMGGEGEYDSKPVHRVHLERFQIARVPVTNAQYLFFVAATGHKSPKHWEDDRPPHGLESHPVVYVAWHDAIAYCRWLSEVTCKPITLPSEAQWEKAARGGIPSPAGGRGAGGEGRAREYPWGDEWDETKCNTRELGLEGTTPVGIFPEGASPYGCLDMAGNVWEWTRSLLGQWKDNKTMLEFGYPYDPGDGREDLEAGDDILRVLRGGSFSYLRHVARCACRSGYFPHRDWGSSGFRVVDSPISPSSAL